MNVGVPPNCYSGPASAGRVRLDLHAHSRYSPDSKLEPLEIVKVAKREGLDGIAITDHNAVEGARGAKGYARSVGLLVILATEVSTREGHVLAYGVTEPIPRDQSVSKTVDDILAAGGVPVAAHPYRFWSGLGEARTVEATFAAFEVQNARTLRGGNVRARALADRQRVGSTGGSDAHFLGEIGRAVTIVEGASTEGEVLEERGRRRGGGNARGLSAREVVDAARRASAGSRTNR